MQPPRSVIDVRNDWTSNKQMGANLVEKHTKEIPTYFFEKSHLFSNVINYIFLAGHLCSYENILDENVFVIHNMDIFHFITSWCYNVIIYIVDKFQFNYKFTLALDN